MRNQTATPNNIPLRRRLLYVAFIYAIFLLLLLFVEVIARVAFPRVESLELFVATPQQQMQVASPQQSSIFEGDPLLLWRLKPNLDHAIWDFTVVSTNAQHFRADYPIAAKPAGTFRVVCLGDSVTFGYRVPTVWPDKPKDYDPEWQPFPMLLEKELRKANPDRQIEVFPMAVPGYTTHQGLAWLRRDIDYLKPDMVIASFGWNDVSVSDVPDRQAIDTRWFPVTIRWLIDHSQIFARLTRRLRSRDAALARAVAPASRVSEAEYIENFNAIVNLARSHQASVIVIGAPYRDSTTNPPEAQLMTRYRAGLKSAMQQGQTPYLEILELTEAAGSVNQGFFGELIHPNHIGHRLMASELLKLMAQRHLLGDLNIPDFVP
ncbi:MAG TPA: GDSL-type esterase/lipase family protein, partial [Pyrinomonadaceae bacterium]|nr:GDSL-type esterase/lipase family protein [Pyrinomonadaceae bacterium]